MPSLNHPNKRKRGACWGPRWRDSDLFPTLPSTPPAAPCWAKLSRAYLHPSSSKIGANQGPGYGAGFW